jgi:Nucleotidyl transferase of unknown function (DUF2204)
VKPTGTSTTDAALVWQHQIEPAEWTVYHRVIQEARSTGVRFAFGGAFATAVYTGQLRNTKDFDFYIRPEDREAMIGAIARAGLHDHFDRLSYDRKWIYRASEGDVIVDTIWAMANLRATVDDNWLSAGPEVSIHGEQIRAIPIEELIWSKLYVLQRERTDWGDVFNLIDARADTIDWTRLLSRVAEDKPLLAGALSVFGWLAPARAQDIRPDIWNELGLREPALNPDREVSRRRADLLDSRPWFHRTR